MCFSNISNTCTNIQTRRDSEDFGFVFGELISQFPLQLVQKNWMKLSLVLSLLVLLEQDNTASFKL
jgi:hypothetical protein